VYYILLLLISRMINRVLIGYLLRVLKRKIMYYHSLYL